LDKVEIQTARNFVTFEWKNNIYKHVEGIPRDIYKQLEFKNNILASFLLKSNKVYSKFQ